MKMRDYVKAAKEIGQKFLDWLAMWKYRYIWRVHNQHNGTECENYFFQGTVSVGNGSYGSLHVMNNGSDYKLLIGNFCSIAPEVVFVISADHSLNRLSTFPFKVKYLGEDKPEAISKGNIVVDDDVWIGYGAIILSGVHIGQGAVIAAGSVVTKDIPAYAIVGGNPAKVIKYRFSNEMVSELISVDYSKLTRERILEHQRDLYAELTDATQVDWMPRK